MGGAGGTFSLFPLHFVLFSSFSFLSGVCAVSLHCWRYWVWCWVIPVGTFGGQVGVVSAKMGCGLLSSLLDTQKLSFKRIQFSQI